MKLKQQPDDFQVEELTSLSASGNGPFALYRLEKRGWSTPDALAAVRHRWRIEPRRISCGGLKDRHAFTIQFLTIFHGPQRGLRHQEVTVQYVGQVAAPYTSQDIEANRFRLTLRDLDPAARPEIEGRLLRLANEGVPNYFDDQRFGSVGGEGEQFIGRLLVNGQFEQALRLALTSPYEHDRSGAKKEKRVLVLHWGNWARCLELLPRGHTRRLVEFLQVHSGDFQGAVIRLRPELRGLYLSAYQSHLWNRMLAHWLRQHCLPAQLCETPLRLGRVPFLAGLDADRQKLLAGLCLPLPSARLRLEESDPRAEVVCQVMEEEGLELHDLQVRGVRELFFSRGERAALCLPRELTHHFEADERHRGRDQLILGFTLPRGCYATLVVKAIMGQKES